MSSCMFLAALAEGIGLSAFGTKGSNWNLVEFTGPFTADYRPVRMAAPSPKPPSQLGAVLFDSLEMN